MSIGGTIQPNRLYLQRGMAMNHRRYIGCTMYWMIRFNHTGYICNVAGAVPFNRTRYIRSVPGTAHRPFPTVSLIGVFLNRRIWKADTYVTKIIVHCPLSIVNSKNCQLIPTPLSTVSWADSSTTAVPRAAQTVPKRSMGGTPKRSIMGPPRREARTEARV